MKHLFATSLGCLTLAMACGAQVPSWIEFKTTPAPDARQNHPLVYDSFRGVCVQFGGWGETPGSIANGSFNDTWEWDGVKWTLINTPNSPPLWAAHAMAFDSWRNVTVVAGNRNPNQTWEYDGTDWTQIVTTNNLMLQGGHRTMTFDSGRGVCVYYGYDSAAGTNETWEWDGKDWKQINTATVPAGNCSSCSIAYDSLRQRTVKFGGNGQTWEYDGTDWTQINTPTSPPGRSCSFGMVYDDARQVIVIFGGCGAVGNDAATWEYDGVDWREHKTVNAPTTQRRYFGMAYDSRRRRTVLFGGRDFSLNPVTVDNVTWEYSRDPCYMRPNTSTISITAGGSQRLSVDAGTAHSSNPFLIVGSMSGTSPGLSVFGPHVYLNADVYTTLALGLANTSMYVNFRGVLDLQGKATADFVVPPALVPGPFNLHHAAMVHLSSITCFSNPVLVQLK